MTIVLARIDTAYEIAEYGRIDLGERHKIREIPKPVALVWINKGTDADKAKAERFAAAEGYKVFCYSNERNPIEKAKTDIMKQYKH